MFKNCFKFSADDLLEEQKIQENVSEARENKDSIITHETPAVRMASIILMTMHGFKKTP